MFEWILLPRALLGENKQGFTSAIQPIPINNKQISRELAQRILDNVLENEQQKGKLLVGQLPSQLPVELPLPNDAEIVGSFNREDSLIIFLEVPQTPERIEQFYQQQLTAASWEKYDNFEEFKKNGFISSGYKPFEMKIFCNKQQGWQLYFNTYPSDSNYTDMRLQINKITSSSLCSFPLDKESKNNTEILLKQISAPILTAPENPEVLFLNPVGGSGMNSSIDRDGNVSLNKYNSGATIQTELSIEELANHYFAQMPKSGWTQVSEIQKRAIAVGLWTFQNEQGNNFQAAINIIKNQEFPQQYSANLSIIPTEDME